jgi:CheY-like chemotaxis protein
MPLRVLLEVNYRIYSDLVENGIEEVDAFVKNMEKTCCQIKYKLVLTDLNMPEMDGFDAAKNIKIYQLNQEQDMIPIVAVTAYDDEETFENCLKIGMEAVLNKPVSVDMLDKIIQRHYYGNKHNDSSSICVYSNY